MAEIESAVIAKLDLGKALAKLTARQRQVIELRHGLAGQPAGKISEVAKEIGISQTSVRYHEWRAIAKICRLLGANVENQQAYTVSYRAPPIHVAQLKEPEQEQKVSLPMGNLDDHIARAYRALGIEYPR